MTELEQRLGMKLCHRRGSFRLTQHGEIVHRAAIDLYGALEQFQDQIHAAHDVLSGELKIGYVDQLISHPEFRLREALQNFNQIAPRVRVTLRVTSTDEIERGVLAGEIDFGIVPDYRRLPGLTYRSYVEEVQKLYCASGHPLFSRPDTSIDLPQIAGANHAISGYMDPARLYGDDLRVEPGAIAYGAEALAQLILTGRYVGMLPVHHAEQWTRNGAMRPLLSDRFTIRRQFSVIRRKNNEGEHVVDQFLIELIGTDQAGI